MSSCRMSGVSIEGFVAHKLEDKGRGQYLFQAKSSYNASNASSTCSTS